MSRQYKSSRKRLVFDFLHQVAVAGGDHAGVDAHRLGVADAFEFPFLQDAQQLDLELQRRGVDLVEKDGAAVRGLEPSGAVVDCPGEGAAHVPEQFAFEQIFVQRRSSP